MGISHLLANLLGADLAVDKQCSFLKCSRVDVNPTLHAELGQR